jgi:chromosome segregation ATPase
MLRIHRSRRGVACVVATCLAIVLAPAHADDDKRLALTRDALHRAQQALQTVQAERDALQQKNVTLEQEKAARDRELAQATARARDAGAQRARTDAALSSAQGERDRLKTTLDGAQADRTTLQQQLAETQARLAQAQAQAADQRRTTLAIGALLQRSVQSLDAAEKQNHALADQGRVALDSWRTCETSGSGHVQATLGEPGFAGVWAESRAEVLRREMEALTGPAKGTTAR